MNYRKHVWLRWFSSHFNWLHCVRVNWCVLLLLLRQFYWFFFYKSKQSVRPVILNSQNVLIFHSQKVSCFPIFNPTAIDRGFIDHCLIILHQDEGMCQCIHWPKVVEQGAKCNQSTSANQPTRPLSWHPESSPLPRQGSRWRPPPPDTDQPRIDYTHWQRRQRHFRCSVTCSTLEEMEINLLSMQS